MQRILPCPSPPRCRDGSRSAFFVAAVRSPCAAARLGAAGLSVQADHDHPGQQRRQRWRPALQGARDRPESASLKQPVIVENRVGANSVIASLAVVNAKPDGYTLLFGNASSTVINQAVQKKPRFDSLTDLTAIAQVGAGGVALVATPDFPGQQHEGIHRRRPRPTPASTTTRAGASAARATWSGNGSSARAASA